MDRTAPVTTGLEGQSCAECGSPLPPRPVSAKEHRFCPGSKCRSAWHAKRKKKAIEDAILDLDAALAYITREGVNHPVMVASVRAARERLELAR